MAKRKTQKFEVQDAEIHFFTYNDEDYMSISDIVKKFGDSSVIYNWMRSRNTIEYMGTWEQLCNPNFNNEAFNQFRMDSGLNTFTMSPKKWVENTNAIGIVSKAGRYGGGTYAHKDIALEFCSWASPVFKLYLVKEFQKLKEIETEKSSLDWNLRRVLTKINYRFHTDAVKDYLIPIRLEELKQAGRVYAAESDILNVALFGITAKQWKVKNPKLKGNIRDHANSEQLLVLSNLENLNAEFIKLGIDREERLQMLNETAIHQIQTLVSMKLDERLPQNNKKLKK